MSLRTAATAFLQQRRRSRAAGAAVEHDAAQAVRRPAAPTTKDVAIGGQTGSTVA